MKIMKVTYEDRNHNEHVEIVDLEKYCKLVQSLIWRKGEIKKVEHLS